MLGNTRVRLRPTLIDDLDQVVAMENDPINRPTITPWDRTQHEAAVRIPDFSDRHEVTHEALVEALFRLEVEPSLQLLSQIFPVLENPRSELDWGEPSTYAGDREQSYAQEHATLFRPIAADRSAPPQSLDCCCLDSSLPSSSRTRSLSP